MIKHILVRLALFLYIAVGTPLIAQSQGVVTASAFFKSLSDRYAAMRDFQARVTITSGGTMQADLSCKPPLLRMDFTSPKGQTIVFNGDALIVYLPSLSAVLQQVCDIQGEASLGLSLISRYYAVQYAASGENSDPDIVTLTAYPRGASEAFRSITMDVDRNSLLLVHVAAAGRNGGTTEMSFRDYKINQGIPNERFVYDPPSSANYYNNFLSGSEQ